MYGGEKVKYNLCKTVVAMSHFKTCFFLNSYTQANHC